MSSVHIPAGHVELDGELILPPSAKGVVLFAHSSGIAGSSGHGE